METAPPSPGKRRREIFSMDFLSALIFFPFEMKKSVLAWCLNGLFLQAGAVAHATASIFVRIGVKIKQYQCPKQKHVQQIFSKIRNFRWIWDAYAFLNCLIIRLILKMTAALSAKTMCNSPFIIAQSPFRAFAVPHACSCQMRGHKYPVLCLLVHDPID